MSPTSSTFRALRHHNYRLWAGADIVSVTGTWMQVLGVNWLILTLTGSATSVGLSLVMQALPTLVLGMWGAGALLPVTGTGGLFVINAASFFVVIAAVAAMRPAEFHALAAEERQPGAVLGGLRYVLRTPWLLVILALWFVSGSLGRNYQVTMAAMSAGPLESGAGGYGLLSTVFAAGTVLGGFLAATRPNLTVRPLLVMTFATGVAQALSGLMPSLWTFAAVLLPIAAGAVALDTTVSARAQIDSPEAMRGRVIAALSIVSAGAGALGGPLLGRLSDTFGPRVALEIGGVACVAASLLAAVGLARLSGRTVKQAIRVRPRLENV
ncbi:MFS transporter [Nonomuraea fuscirosea]|uniref:MFS transporter n=1 Tax=Nonomuraea fuscirosea TaxID=1291556 RepID=UPI0034188810